MKNTRLIASAAAASLLVTAFSLIVAGDDLVYDSTTDPLVSLSYINEVVIPQYETKLSEYNAKLADYDKKLTAYDEKSAVYSDTISKLTKQLNELSAANMVLAAEKNALADKVAELEAKLADGAGSKLEVVYLKKGQKLLADTACEIIIRSGNAIVVSITTNGINDITDGTELFNAAPIPLYHSLLVPRGGDGRGIQVTSEDSYVMVRGGYQIVD